MLARLHHIVILFVCLAILAVVFVFRVDELGLYLFGYKWPLHRLFHHPFGLKCALCGLTHSFYSLAHGDFQKAFQFHRLGPIIFAFILFQIPYRIWAIAIGPGEINKKLRRINALFAAIVLLAVFVNWLAYLGSHFAIFAKWGPLAGLLK